ncbi:hypothetical protein P3W45_000364 [Vairimorpha bombi]|jgi:hypothetical protein
MKYSETNLLKLLQYTDLKKSSMLEKISSSLNIQYFEDNGVYTLGSKQFVLDINKQIKIIYVDDSYSKLFEYVEFYLTHFFESKQYVEFYNHLKYFINFLEFYGTGKKTGSCENIRNLADLCDCLRNYNYCNIYDVQIRNKKFTFNIFTHRYEYHSFGDLFISVPQLLFRDGNLDLSLGYNLSECYLPNLFNIKLLKYFKNSYYKKIIKDREILVDKDGRIFVNGEYDKTLSFLFKRGNNLGFLI